MVWAVSALQTGREGQASRFLRYPSEAATSDISSKYAMHPWKLETLVNELLAQPKAQIRQGKNRRLNCQFFEAIASVNHALTKLEDAEDGLTLQRVDVLREMHRLIQRQLEWQVGRGANAQRLYRSGYIYGGQKAQAFFAEKNKLTVNEFSFACLMLRSLYEKNPIIHNTGGMESIGISKEALDATFDLITIPHPAARDKARTLRSPPGHVSYKRSLLREYPCISFDLHNRHALAPLVELLVLRSTTGLFYDMIKGGSDIRNEIASRYECYSYELLTEMLPSYEVNQSYEYSLRKGFPSNSPDVMVSDHAGISLIFECKATRMSYEARFSENPVVDAARGYEEIAKGVFQIWKFVSHHRRGILPTSSINTDAKGVVLTLDPWLSMARPMKEDVLQIARRICAEKDPDITSADHIPIIFCPIEELEFTLLDATERSFFDAIQAASRKDFDGWQLSGVHREIAPNRTERRLYPFRDRIGEVWPWWDSIDI
ncbi:hypothetical protein [Parvibaculum sp.]|uniref:hypothetical protein n=1 Tax=Parvibaculum sp. TaxID=2024848 RepID=UPI003297ED37